MKSSSIENILETLKPDIIFYFAGQSSIVKSYLNPKQTISSNTSMVNNFLTILKKKKLDTKFVKANSGYIFSNLNEKNLVKPRLIKPNSPYVFAQSKAFKLVNDFREKKVNCYSAIFFNAESSLRPETFFIKKACHFVRNNKFKKIKLKIGNIDLFRDFGWAPELVQGAFYMTKAQQRFESSQSELIRAKYDYIFKIKKLDYKKYIQVEKKFFRKNEIKNISCDISATIKKLKSFKWRPNIYGKKLVHKIYNNL